MVAWRLIKPPCVKWSFSGSPVLSTKTWASILRKPNCQYLKNKGINKHKKNKTCLALIAEISQVNSVSISKKALLTIKIF